MAKAIWNNRVLAQSDTTVVVEGNHYFPYASLDMSLFRESDKTTFCPWKGTANYYSLDVDGKVHEDAAWVYREPKDDAKHIRGHVAFGRGVTVEA